MVTDILNVPKPSKESRQRSASISDVYFARIIPSWSQPSSLTPNQWRAWVSAQPVAVTCKETMTSNILDLDWKITPRKSDQRDELKGVISYYEKLLRRGGNSGLDWAGFIEWSLQDLLDLPFGSAWEIGRKGDEPNGRVAWMEPIDGGTLYPTNNKDVPVVQYYAGYMANFPAHSIARMYLNPRTEIERKGWGMAPPEKIFLAMEMLARGDKYYANLLLDIPPVGVFDLGDIIWEDANEWIKSFREFTAGGTIDSFKIPVLAQHTSKVQFIALGKDPNAIMYDTITLKYAALTVAGYGMSLGDIGLQGSSKSGETLAGSIRSEQKTNRTGKARIKAKIKYFIESIIPPELQFDFIDTDGERLSMLGRARLANATAMNQYREMEAISPQEARLQAIQDGLFTISMPEEPPKEAKKELPTLAPNGKKAPERPGQVGSPQPPSLGGDGEVKRSIASFIPENLNRTIENIVTILAPMVYETIGDNHDGIKELILESVFSTDDTLGLGSVIPSMMGRVGTFNLSGLEEELAKTLELEELNANTEPHIEILAKRIQDGFPEFLGKAIAYNMIQSEYLDNPKDIDGMADFSELANELKSKIYKSLPDYISAHVGIEIQNIVEEAKNHEMEIPEPIRIRSLTRKTVQQPINVSVNPQFSTPDVTVNVPERISHVTIEPAEVHVSQPEINVESPVVNFSAPENKITVNVPKQDAPIVNLSQTQPAIQINIPEQQPPTVNINPTPVNIENVVNIPEPKPINKSITIVKDGENVWRGESNSE